MSRVTVWYSDGGASACAAALAVAKYGARCEIVKCDTTANEHPDNYRFRADVERWIGRKITLIRNEKYQTLADVAEGTRYMAGPNGARCTVELKKVPRYAHQRPGDLHVFGYTADEGRRIQRFTENEWQLRTWFPLHQFGIDKHEVYRIIERAGIAQPMMYRLGFDNNNCLGCWKAQSPRYWNRIRHHFPEAFAERVRQSRKLGVRLVRVKGERIFLDELDPSFMAEDYVEVLDCGPFCETDFVQNDGTRFQKRAG